MPLSESLAPRKPRWVLCWGRCVRWGRAELQGARREQLEKAVREDDRVLAGLILGLITTQLWPNGRVNLVNTDANHTVFTLLFEDLGKVGHA